MSLENQLRDAARRGELDVVTYLLDRGVNVDARNWVSIILWSVKLTNMYMRVIYILGKYYNRSNEWD